MGWLFSHYSRKQMIEELVKTDENDRGGWQTLRHCVRGNVLWAKERYTNKETQTATVYVTCYLMQRSGNQWGYKSIPEDAGPLYNHCPISYLEGLSEPQAFAVDWRNRVRQYWDKRKAT